MNMKPILKNITPPILWNFFKIFNPDTSAPSDGNHLFDGDDALFKELVSQVSYYGEYGVGQSTAWVLGHTSAHVFSVDTSKQWIENVKSNLKPSNKFDLEWVDLGVLGDWGYPCTYEKRGDFHKYIESIWTRENKPELVLIDGRFRVCCFLYSLLRGEPGTKIIFDDYTNRPNYHVVEEFIAPKKTSGRQAVFVVPETLDSENIEIALKQFLYVMD